jgi:outer membrane autotransporter protein
MLLQPYAKVALATEFVNSNTVKVNDDNFVSDLSGTRHIYQAGINAQLTPSLSVSADASYISGTHVEANWTGNVGLGYSFK